MRWYVSKNGESTGPHEESTVAEWARTNQLDGAMLRDEAASAWVPVSQTPFCTLQGSSAPQPVGKAVPGNPPNVTLAQALFVICIGLFVVYGYATCGDSKSHASTSDSPPSPLPTTASPTVAKSAPGAIEAWVMSKEFVKRILKSPGSAEFGGVFSGDYQDPKERCSPTGDGAWKCSGWVDSQNGFGAKLRANFAVTVKPDADGGSWHAIAGPVLDER